MNITLKNLIVATVEEELSSLFESIRGFNLERLKQIEDSRGMICCAAKHLPRLGRGSNRTVFGWKADKVIKIANQQENVQQNKREVEQYCNNSNLQPFLSTIYDYDKDNFFWLVSEDVQVIADNKQLKNKFFSEIILSGLTPGVSLN